MTGDASPVEAKMVGENSIMKGGGPNSALAVHPDRTGPPEGDRQKGAAGRTMNATLYNQTTGHFGQKGTFRQKRYTSTKKLG